MIFNEANFPELPRSWASLTVDDSVDSAGNSNKKLRSKDALEHGSFPVIDQGKNEISGYSNDKSLVVDASDASPVILFGDHTRILKKITRPFVPGADGTKLFRAKSFWDTRFVYQMLRAIKLPDKGYARHFQYLRDSVLPLPPLNEQKCIADKLDSVLARVDACCDRLDLIPAILKRFRQSILAAATSGKLTEDWRAGKEYGVIAPFISGEHGEWSSQSLPDGWLWRSFTDCFEDATDSIKKLPQKNYQEEGPLAVVDQGEDLVGGYTARTELKSSATLPVIIFGDHTRCVKWVDFPFVQGADGVKVLVPSAGLLPRYSYFMLIALRLPDKGYSRHSKFLRASLFPFPPTDEQTEIVRRVEALFAFANRLDARYTAARAKVEKLTPATLAKAFRGELVPQDPNDEPASKLLERIRVTRLSKNR